MKRLRTPGYDIEGNGFFRVFRLNMLNKLVPIGNLRNGTGIKPALVLLCLHWFGRPVFRLLIRYEPLLHKLYLRIGKTR